MGRDRVGPDSAAAAGCVLDAMAAQLGPTPALETVQRSDLSQVLPEFAAALEKAPPGQASARGENQALGGLLCKLKEAEVNEGHEGVFPKPLVVEISTRHGQLPAQRPSLRVGGRQMPLPCPSLALAENEQADRRASGTVTFPRSQHVSQRMPLKQITEFQILAQHVKTLVPPESLRPAGCSSRSILVVSTPRLRLCPPKSRSPNPAAAAPRWLRRPYR